MISGSAAPHIELECREGVEEALNLLPRLRSTHSTQRVSIADYVEYHEATRLIAVLEEHQAGPPVGNGSYAEDEVNAQDHDEKGADLQELVRIDSNTRVKIVRQRRLCRPTRCCCSEGSWQMPPHSTRPDKLQGQRWERSSLLACTWASNSAGGRRGLNRSLTGCWTSTSRRSCH